MDKLVLVIVCLVLGIALRRSRAIPEHGALVLNKFVICVSLPAVIIHYVHAMDFAAFNTAQLLAPVTLPWLLFFGAWGLMLVIGRWRRWHPHTIACLTLCAGLGNTSFVGFPLIEALTGPEGLPTAVLLDQLGTFLVMSIAGVGLASWYAGNKPDLLQLLKKVMRFPPFVALILALVTQPFELPPMLQTLLLELGATLVPLALTAVGMQLIVSREILRLQWRSLAAGLGYKLLLAPLAFYLLYGAFIRGAQLGCRC